MNHDQKKKGPTLEERTQSLQDSIAALTERLKTQNRSLQELRDKVRAVEGEFGKVSARASFLKATVSSPNAAPIAPKPAPSPAYASAPVAVKPAPGPSPISAPKPAPVAVDLSAFAPMAESDTGFFKPALALLLLSAVAYGSADIQDTFTKGLKGIASLEISGTRPAARQRPVRRTSLPKKPQRRAPAPEKAPRLATLPRKLPSIPLRSGETEEARGMRDALRMVYAFRPPGWRSNVLAVLGNKSPDPLMAEPTVERVDRDIYQVIFTTPRKGGDNQTFSFEADVVGQTVFINPETAQKLAYHSSL